MSVDLAVQKGIRARLVATSAVTALVPATSILDRNQRPAPSPSIIMGESQLVDQNDSIKRRLTRVFHTAHVWKREPSLVGAKAIAGAMRTAIHADRLSLDTGFHAVDAYVSQTRFLRDPDGEHSHGVVTIAVLVQETGA